MTKFLIIIFIAISLIGCSASNLKIKKSMDPWLGQNVDLLIIKWGAPAKVYKLPSGDFTTYTWIYGQENQSYCRFDWTANSDNIIVSYRHEGQCVLKK